MAYTSTPLPFFPEGAVEREVANLAARFNLAREKAEKSLQSWRSNNAFDPFSMAFELALNGISIDEWVHRETARQINKSLSNALGDFHQALIGELPGWQSTGAQGGLFDLIHSEPFGDRAKPAIAEVKNKFNTLNAGGQEKVYDTFQNIISMPQYKGYDCYLVQVVQKHPSGNIAWHPAKRGIRNDIRLIGAKELYAQSTGDSEAFHKLFKCIYEILDADYFSFDTASVGALNSIFASVYSG